MEMSEYLTDNGFLKQYAERTIKNLEVIEQMATTETNSAFEVTQLINSLLALIVFPKERNLSLKTSAVWEKIFRQHIVCSRYGNISGDEILRQLRHAISHSHILFEKNNLLDSDGNAQIGKVIFVSCKFTGGKSKCPSHSNSNCWKCKLKNNSNDNPDLQIEIPVNELRKCVTSLASEIIKSVDAQTKTQNTNTKGSR